MSNHVAAQKFTGFTAIPVGTTNVAPFSAFAPASNMAGPTVMYVTLEGSAVRYRLDGISAHSATGHLFTPTSPPLVIQGMDAILGFNVICPTVTGTLQAELGVV